MLKTNIVGNSLIIFLLLFSSTCSSSEFPTNNDFIFHCDTLNLEFKSSNYNIILIAGQSNTHEGLGLDNYLDIADGRVKQLGRFKSRNLKVVDAIEPLDHYTATEGKIGFGLTFSNLFAKFLLNKGDSIIVIPCGFGGTGFIDHKWNKGDSLYKDAVYRVKYVLNKYPGSKLQVILWHQGEKDVGNSNYEIMLDNFINDIRNDLQAPLVPFILGGMVPYWVNKDEARMVQQNILASTKMRLIEVGYADPYIPTVIEKKDKTTDAIHYDAKGQRELGKRYFNEFLCLIKNGN